MARSQQMFTQPGQMYAPDTQRKLAMAQALRSQGLQMPQGTSMGSGAMQRFAAPHWSQYVGNLAQNLSGAYMEHKAEQTNQDRMSELVQALRGTDSPEYVMQPGYEQPSQMDRLAALEDNPLAQNAMIQLATQEPAQQYQTLSPDQAAQLGLPEGVWQMSPDGQIKAAYEAEDPDYNQMIIEGPDGQPMINPLYVQGKEQIAAAGGTNVNVNTGPSGIDYGEPEKGLVWARNEDGTVKLDERGAPIAVPYQGGSVYTEQQEAAEQSEQRQEMASRYASIVVEDIDRAIDMVENSSIPTTGFVGNVLSSVPGTPAHDLYQNLQSIKSNIGFDKLQEMREASPTGGALGQVSEMENRLLQATYGSLEQSQTKEQFLYNMRRLRDIKARVINEGIPDDEAAQLLQGVGRTPEDQNVDSLLDKYAPQ